VRTTGKAVREVFGAMPRSRAGNRDAFALDQPSVELAVQEVMHSVVVHYNHDKIHGLAAKLKAPTAARDRDQRNRTRISAFVLVPVGSSCFRGGAEWRKMNGTPVFTFFSQVVKNVCGYSGVPT
jgi:hypothetical protein